MLVTYPSSSYPILHDVLPGAPLCVILYLVKFPYLVEFCRGRTSLEFLECLLCHFLVFHTFSVDYFYFLYSLGLRKLPHLLRNISLYFIWILLVLYHPFL